MNLDLDLDCRVVPVLDGSFGVVLVISGIGSHQGADVVAQWVRSSLMGNLEVLGQMCGGTAHRATPGPNKSLS